MYMEHQVLYRKYRPRFFGEVTGQEMVVTTLANSLANKRISHAYLFYGPRGTGKTTIARIFAKGVNCTNLSPAESGADKLSIRRSSPTANEGGPLSGDPCGICDSCKDFQEGRAMDLIEIDAASNTGVDDIRELKEGIRFSPAKAKYKVFIIDEFHMLSKSAFNALLKTLEEPPEHAIFILATTEIEKVPATVLSRVQRFDFRKLGVHEIVARLKDIAEKEKISASDDALMLVAQNASGSLRDSESMLNQIISYAGDTITAKHVEEILGLVPMVLIAQFIDLLFAKDAKGSLEFLTKTEEEGHNLHQFVKALLEYVRQIALAKVDPAILAVSGEEFTKEEKDIIVRQAGLRELPALQKLLVSLLEAEGRMKYSEFPILPLELVVIENLRQ